MTMSLLWVLLSSLLLVTQSHGARILGLFPFPARSHLIVQKALLFELVKRGHHVTSVSPFPESKPIENLTDIRVLSDLDAISGGHVPKNLFDMEGFDVFKLVIMMWYMGESVCDNVLREDSIQKLIHSKDLKFDLIIVEAFVNECMLGFAHKFKAPVIQVCPYGGSNFMADWVGSPNQYSYVPDEFLSYKDKMNFWERMHNTLMALFRHIGRQLIYIPKQDAVMRKHFNYTKNMPHISELEAKTSLVLLNSHYTLNYPKPFMPNYVQVGGMHVKPPKKLPQDLEKYISEAQHGVIYFSMGSNLQSSQMPEPQKQAFLQAFSKLKQKVLWKWETDTLPGQPSNVKLGKWLPQSDILAHPNVRLFITHGGLLSTQEAINRGVPLIGIPVFADQSLNMDKAVSSGYAVMLDFKNVTVESLLWAIKEVVEAPKYRENARHLSRIFRDQPLSPLEQAVFWTEYVIRHKGAPHMRSAALDLTWYQYFLLDVITVLLLAIISVFLVMFLIFRVIFRKICSGGSRKLDSESKKKKRN